MVGSEFVQKYLGEGPRMVRDVFRMAKDNAPSIVFMKSIQLPQSVLMLTLVQIEKCREF